MVRNFPYLKMFLIGNAVNFKGHHTMLNFYFIVKKAPRSYDEIELPEDKEEKGDIDYTGKRVLLLRAYTTDTSRNWIPLEIGNQ